MNYRQHNPCGTPCGNPCGGNNNNDPVVVMMQQPAAPAAASCTCAPFTINVDGAATGTVDIDPTIGGVYNMTLESTCAITVNAGALDDCGDATGGTGELSCGGTIHYTSSDDSVGVTVTDDGNGGLQVDLIVEHPVIVSADADNVIVEGDDGGAYIDCAAIAACISPDIYVNAGSTNIDATTNTYEVILTDNDATTPDVVINMAPWVSTYAANLAAGTWAITSAAGSETIASTGAEADNLLNIGANGGSYLTCADIGGCLLSGDAGQILSLGTDGALLLDCAAVAACITIPAETALVVTTDGSTAGVAQSGVNGHTLDITILGDVVGNLLSVSPNGGVGITCADIAGCFTSNDSSVVITTNADGTTNFAVTGGAQAKSTVTQDLTTGEVTHSDGGAPAVTSTVNVTGAEANNWNTTGANGGTLLDTTVIPTTTLCPDDSTTRLLAEISGQPGMVTPEQIAYSEVINVSIGTSLIQQTVPAEHGLATWDLWTVTYTNNTDCQVRVHMEYWQSVTSPHEAPGIDYAYFANHQLIATGGLINSKIEASVNGHNYGFPDPGAQFYRPWTGGDVQNWNLLNPGQTVTFTNRLRYRNIDGLDTAIPLDIYWGGAKIFVQKNYEF